MIHYHKLILLAVVPAAPVLAPEPLREAIADNPIGYAVMAVGAALFGGFAVQYRAWLYGKVSVAQAFSELTFSAIAGLVAWWLAHKRNHDWTDLIIAAILMGAAGRPLVESAKKVAHAGLVEWMKKFIGASIEREEKDMDQGGDA